jgi:hypothetical protein
VPHQCTRCQGKSCWPNLVATLHSPIVSHYRVVQSGTSARRLIATCGYSACCVHGRTQRCGPYKVRSLQTMPECKSFRNICELQHWTLVLPMPDAGRGGPPAH